MPRTVLAVSAGALGTNALDEPGEQAISEALDQARFYLRRDEDTDGVNVYRLFHQSLADYLCEHPRGQDDLATRRDTGMNHGAILDRLLNAIGANNPNSAGWANLAVPYLLRHAIAHAASSERVETLLADAEFLVHADPESLARHLHQVTAAEGRRTVAVYRMSQRRLAAVQSDARRSILTIDAVRLGEHELAKRLCQPPDRASARWHPVWATGAPSGVGSRLTMTGHDDAINSAAWTVLSSGSEVLVTVSNDKTVRVWDLTTGVVVHRLIGHSDRVSAVSCAQLENGTDIAVTTSDDQTARVWDLATGATLYVLTGHGHQIWGVACTELPDGAQVAVTVGHRTGRVWDLATGELRYELIGHDGPVIEVACTTLSDGTNVAVTTSWDKTARVWDLTTGIELHVLSGHRGDVRAVAFSHRSDGVVLAVTGSTDYTARIWDLATGATLHVLEGHSSYVVAVACTRLADGTDIAVTASSDGTAIVWDVETGTERHTLTGHTQGIKSVACTVLTNGSVVGVTGGMDGTAIVWDLATGAVALTFTGGGGQAMFARLGVSTDVAVTAGIDVRVWDIAADNTAFSALTGHMAEVNAIACGKLNDNSTVVATGSNDGTTTIRDLATGRQRLILTTGRSITPGISTNVRCVNLTRLSNGKDVAITGLSDLYAGHSVVWDLTNPDRPDFHTSYGATLFRDLAVHSEWVSILKSTRLIDGADVAVSAAGITSREGIAWIWDLDTGETMHTLTGHTERLEALAISRLDDGTDIAITASADGTARVWDLATGATRHTLTGHTGVVRAIATTRLVDGTDVAVTAGLDGTARGWDLASGIMRHSLASHSGAIGAVTCARLLGGTIDVAVIGDANGTLQLWDLASAQVFHIIAGHGGAVKAIACTTLHDGTDLIVAASADGTVRLWDAGDGRCELITLPEPPHWGASNILATGPDGEVVVAFGRDVACFRRRSAR